MQISILHKINLGDLLPSVIGILFICCSPGLVMAQATVQVSANSISNASSKHASRLSLTSKTTRHSKEQAKAAAQSINKLKVAKSAGSDTSTSSWDRGTDTLNAVKDGEQYNLALPMDTTQKEKAVMQINMQDSVVHLIPFQDKTGKWGYLDRTTKQVRITSAYLWADLFDHGVAKVTQSGTVTDAGLGSNADDKAAKDLYGWIDRTGKVIFQPQFTSIYEVNAFLSDKKITGLQLVGLPNGTYGVVDLNKEDWVVRPGLYNDFRFYDRTHYLADKKVFIADGIKHKAPPGCSITSVDLENKTFRIQKGNELHKGVSSWAGGIIVAPKYLDITYLPEVDRYIASRLYKSLTGAAFMALLQSGNSAGKIISELIDPSGKVIGSFQADEMADTYQDSLGRYTKNGSDFYFNLITGAPVAAPVPALNSGHYRLFKKNLLWGVIAQSVKEDNSHKEQQPQVIVPPVYTQLVFISDHLLLATKPTGSYSSVQGVLNLAHGGHVLIAFDYARLDYVGPTSNEDGTMQAHFRAYKDGGHGIIDMQGQVIVPLIYYNDVLYTGSRAIVYKDYHTGVIGSKGQVIIAPKYKTIFSSKLRESKPEADRGVIDIVQTMPEYYAVENESGRWGLMDSAGQTVIAFEYGFVSTGAESFEKGWVSIEDTARNHHGKINLRSGVKLPPVYDIIKLYDDFIIVAKRKDNTYYYQLLDIQGQPLTGMVYTGMDFIKEGHYLLCQQDKKYGVLDTKAKVLVPFIYDYLWTQKADLLMAQNEQTYFYLDTKGEIYKDPTK